MKLKYKAMVLSCMDPRFPKLKVELNLMSLESKITKF